MSCHENSVDQDTIYNIDIEDFPPTMMNGIYLLESNAKVQ